MTPQAEETPTSKAELFIILLPCRPGLPQHSRRRLRRLRRALRRPPGHP